MGVTEPPDHGNPYPEGAEPYEPQEGEELEVVAVEYADTGHRHSVAPIVVAVAAGVLANMVYNGGQWSIGKAWNAATREPVIDYTRPPTVYSASTGMVYRLEGNNYVPAGPAQMQ